MTTTGSTRTRAATRPPALAGPSRTPGRPQRPTHLRVVTDDVSRRPVARPAAGSGRDPGLPPLRLTRRGRVMLRVLVLLAMLALMAGTALAMAHRADAADGPARPVPAVAHHVVLPGETLWGIATGLAPSADPRATVARIVDVNALSSSTVQPGQRLAIPPDLSGGR